MTADHTVTMADFLDHQTGGPAALRSLVTAAIADRRPIVLPGCFDALSARLGELAGFDALYMTGFGTTASLLGRPDVGLLGGAEMVDNARRIVDAVALPVVADADTGYGNHLNVVRTVHDYERAGVAAVHLEDQVMPKKCGHMNDKQVVDVDVMVAKIAAAVAARHDPDFSIIARTDARAPMGFDEAMRRGHRFLEAGADMLFVEALIDESEIERAANEFAGVPLVFNWVEGGKTAALMYDDIASLGYALILQPVGPLLAATGAMRDYLARLRTEGTSATFADELLSFDEFTSTIGLDDVVELDRRFKA